MTGAEKQRFAELYGTYRRQVYAYCRRRVGPDVVDDAVSDVFLTVWRRIDDAPFGEEAMRWIYGVAHRVIANHWRTVARRRRLEARLETIGVTPHRLTSDVVVVRGEVRDVMEAAQRLRPAELEILRLAVWEKLGSEDIAAILGIGPSAAKQRLYRARRKLTREYERMQGRAESSLTSPRKEVSGGL